MQKICRFHEYLIILENIGQYSACVLKLLENKFSFFPFLNKYVQSKILSNLFQNMLSGAMTGNTMTG